MNERDSGKWDEYCTGKECEGGQQLAADQYVIEFGMRFWVAVSESCHECTIKNNTVTPDTKTPNSVNKCGFLNFALKGGGVSFCVRAGKNELYECQ